MTHRTIRLLTRRMTMLAARLDADTGWGPVTVILVDDEGIRAINRAVFGRDAVTDVIACRYRPVPGDPPGETGEIVVNVAQALRGGHRGWPAGREFALYLAHGCDHLAGQDDRTETERRRMRRRELHWVRTAAAEGLLPDLSTTRNE